MKTFSTAIQIGSNAGIAIFDHKEPILKGINCNCIMFNNKIYFKSLALLVGQTSYVPPLHADLDELTNRITAAVNSVTEETLTRSGRIQLSR